MRRLAIAGLVVTLAVSGCASMKATPVGAAPGRAQAPADSGAQSTPPTPAAPAAEEDSSSSGSRGASALPPKAPEAATATPPPANVTPGASPATSQPSGVARPVKQAGAASAPPRPSMAATQTTGKPPPPVKQPTPAAAARATPTPAAASQPTPTLNLADLERRLRDTPAIGVFTKLSLKNQVDDLLNAFRDLYRDPSRRPTPALRQRYDLLLLKVLSLLQDSDPPLAAAIAASREAIWSILADPEQFAKI